MSTENGNGSVPPFIEDKPTQPVIAVNWFVTILGWAALTLALIGGAKVVWDYLMVDMTPVEGYLWAQGMALALVFLTGWAISLFSIRRLHNTVFPLVVRAYSFFVALGMASIYGRAMIKYYNENLLNFGKYAFVLFAGFAVLLAFFLLTEEANLQHVAIPLGLIVVFHIFLIVFHYVFLGAKDPSFINHDILFMVLMLFIISLMMAQGVYRPLRRLIGGFVPSIPAPPPEE